MASMLAPSQPSLGAVGSTPSAAAGGADGPDRIFIGGFPYYLTEAQVIELLETFGPLRGFELCQDAGYSKGWGFCVYQDPAVTDVVCSALNGMKMGDKTLTVRRVTDGVHGRQPIPDQTNVIARQAQQLQNLGLQDADNGPAVPETPTKVVCLKQAVTPDELAEDDEYEEILEDMRDECGRYGGVAALVIPRPNANGEEVPGVGKVFVEYNTLDEAVSAKTSLNGRTFGGHVVAAVYFPEDKFLRGEYDFEA